MGFFSDQNFPTGVGLPDRSRGKGWGGAKSLGKKWSPLEFPQLHKTYVQNTNMQGAKEYGIGTQYVEVMARSCVGVCTDAGEMGGRRGFTS